jgi:phosphomannomutase
VNDIDRRLAGFKAYDLRGRVPDELDEELAELIGRAYAHFLKPARVAVGRDMRLSGASLSDSLMRGLTACGVHVVDIGEVGTEQVYFATFSMGFDGGIMVTASHNPADYNGMKFVARDAVPISADTGLGQIRELVAARLRGEGGLEATDIPGTIDRVDVLPDYIAHLLSYVDEAALRSLKVVANAGDGMAGPIVKALEGRLPFEFHLLNATPDGTFPRGVPNPLLPENRAATSAAVTEAGADLGLAWDGDFDRCFFFDERGEFIEGYYLVGLLAEQALRNHPGAAIVHDPRLIWNTIEVVAAAGGRPVVNKSGHAFIKDRMRREDAAYGGEMSAHHYFRDFSYADSGMIPWLLICGLMSSTGRTLSDLVGEMIERYPASGEINLELPDPAVALSALEAAYGPGALAIDHIDGVSLEFSEWRVNVRMSNTEPVVRVNVESRGDVALMRRKTDEILAALEASQGRPGGA